MIDVLRGGIPALVLLVASAGLINAICRRPPFRRLTLALSLGAFAGSLALFRALVAGTDWLAPYDLVLGLLAVVYTAFKIAEILVCDVVATCRTLEDTELLVLTKDALRPLLVGDPAAAERLSQAMTRRQIEHEEAVSAGIPDAPVVATDLASLLLARIRRFFGLLGGDA
jgi:CRP-like cAMP-binding protein